MCRAPTPLTKDVSGEYPLSILPSLQFAVFLFLPLWLFLVLLPPLPSMTVGTSSVLSDPSLPVTCV